MTTIPSLEGQMYLTNPQSIIAYTLRRYSRTPKNTVTILPELIISLPYQLALFGKDPDGLCSNITSDLQATFDRIFARQRRITVNVTYAMTSVTTYDVTVSVIYTLLSGELQQTGTVISLNKETGRLMIPEDKIDWSTSEYKGK